DAGAAPMPTPNDEPAMEAAPAAPATNDPFGADAPANNPFGSPDGPAMNEDPFGAPTTPESSLLEMQEKDDAEKADDAASGGSTTRVFGAAFSAIGNAFTPSLKTPKLPGLGGPTAPSNEAPFGAPPAGSDPFGAPAPANDDPFGTPAPANDDPFAAPASGEMKSNAAPANDDPFASPANNDPFGAPPATDMKEKPAAENSDPFADPFAN
ncbi:MAG: hypothetical protein ACIALR_10795, partial [Blastopirellula sp. JB062]